MIKGTKLIFSSYGFRSDGSPANSDYAEEISFDQFLPTANEVKIIGITKDGHIRTSNAELCKVIDPKDYFEVDTKPVNEKPILG